MNGKRALRYFWIGQFLLYGGLAVCALIDSRGVTTNIGISYYGAHWSTILPYLIALIGCAVFGWLAALTISPSKQTEKLRYGLMLFSILTIGIAITPYNLSDFVYTLHTSFGSTLFFFQFILTAWLAFSFIKSIRLIAIWFLEFAAGLFSAYYLIVPAGYLFISQLVFQVCFVIIVSETLRLVGGSVIATTN